MTLFQILLATLAAGVASVLLAATLALTWLPRFADRMVAYAVGVLLTFAFIDLLPEALALGLSPGEAGWWLLGGRGDLLSTGEGGPLAARPCPR